MWRVVLVAVAGCSSSVCKLDPVIAEDLVIPANTCGGDNLWHELGSDNLDHAPFLAAHDCAMAAIKSETPFVLRWTEAGVDTGDDFALVGYDDHGTYRVRLYDDGYAVVANADAVGYQDCAQISDSGDCSDVLSTMCLACKGDSIQACP